MHGRFRRACRDRAKTEQVKVVDKKAWDEKVLVKEAWTETKEIPAHDEEEIIKEAWDEQVLKTPAYDETVPAHDEQELVKDAWDEEVVTGQKCSKCGEIKQ